MTEEIDHEFTDGMVCPYCGHEQSDIFDITGAYTEDETRTYCDGCEKEFASYCSISYSFTTHKVDAEAEKREREERRADEEERRLARCTEARKLTPGTRIKIKKDSPYSDWLRCRVGEVANREPSRHGLVYVTLDEVDLSGPHTTDIEPEHLERI